MDTSQTCEVIDSEHREIESLIDHLEELILQHFENEEKYMNIGDDVDNYVKKKILLHHQENNILLLEAIDNIAMQLRDHIQTETFHLSS